MNISLIIPTLNESDNIGRLLDDIFLVSKKNKLKLEVVIIDDNSRDGTFDIVNKIKKDKKYNINAICRKDKKGLASAVLDGIDISKGEIIGFMDADLSHPAEKIFDMVKPILNDEAEITIGSRLIEGGGVTNWPEQRRLTSRIATILAKPVTNIKDPMSGFFFFKREVIEETRLVPRGYKIGLEILAKGNYNKAIEIPYMFKNRTDGKSKLGMKQNMEYVTQLGDLYLYKIRKKLFNPMFNRLRESYHYARYRKVRRLLPDKKDLLDIGCGKPCNSMKDGSFIRFLGHGIGMDVKDCKGFNFKRGSITDIPFKPNSFDAITAMEVLEHVEDRDLALNNINRVLRKDGTLVISVPNENTLFNMFWWLWTRSVGDMWKDTHDEKFSKKKFLEDIERHGFKIESVKIHWLVDIIIKTTKIKDE
ncbi:MAG TPA: glycosyltransferase [Candidatus Nanoarchaeia archaeon]|nr:glycosyltransferase [Candidatus Nanoarchaeia archaeon]